MGGHVGRTPTSPWEPHAAYSARANGMAKEPSLFVSGGSSFWF